MDGRFICLRDYHSSFGFSLSERCLRDFLSSLWLGFSNLSLQFELLIQSDDFDILALEYFDFLERKSVRTRGFLCFESVKEIC